MEQKKVITVAELVKAAAMCFIGSAFCVNGCTYFYPQAEYHVPRILLPVFHILGNTGLAIGMLLLGAGLVVYALRRWRKHGGGTIPFIGIIAATIVLYLAIFAFTGKPGIEQDAVEESIQQRDKLVEEVMKTERPTFKNKETNDYIAEFENLLAEYRRHAETGDEQAMAKDWEIYNEMLMRMASVIEPLSNDDKYLFSLYLGKLRIEWGEVGKE